MLKFLLLVFFSSLLPAQAADHALLTSDILFGRDRYLALTIQHEKGWHTYWKNPGDAGIASQFKFMLSDEEIGLEAMEWPTPKRYIEAGDILTFGYGEDPTFFFKLPHSINGNLTIKAQWLICKDICIPGGAEAQILIHGHDDATFKTAQSGLKEQNLRQRLQSLPTEIPWPVDLELYVSRDGDKSLRFDYFFKNKNKSLISSDRNLLTPFLAPPFGFKRESLRYDANERVVIGKLSADWDGDYQEPSYPLPENGRFSPAIEVKFLYTDEFGKTFILKKNIESFSSSSAGLEENLEKLAGVVQDSSKTKKVNFHELTLENILLMFSFAFLGGLILNLMPCVLPVISLKLFGLIKYQDLPQRKVLAHNLTYSAGVIFTFLLLGLALILIKASGEAVGWGFQLQSPLFVLSMVGFLFIMSLNLFGLFEFRTPGGTFLGNIKTKNNFSGDFFSGVLATILSTPCSAPFLGPALAFAFTSGPLLIFVMFCFIGLGLSFPFILTGLFPRLISFLPKPGAWMEKLKYFLGLTMLLTVAWLVDVFMNLVDPTLWLWPLILFFITLFFGFWFRAKISKNLGLNLLFFLIPFAIVLNALQTLDLKPLDRSKSRPQDTQWTDWSPQLMQEKKGQWVFIDFTAAWCLTCKANKKLVLDTGEFLKFSQEQNIFLMRGDWTQRDDVITEFLKSYNIVGVPAYFLQTPQGEVIPLGETISLGKLRSHVLKTNE
jgi:thiol:disulfide interchange protein